MSKEFIIYADESAKSGRFFSNFYGGALVRSEHLEFITAQLDQCKQEEHFYGEVKWQKVTEHYLDKYKRLMDVFFDLVLRDMVKIRIMFTQNRNNAQGLNEQQYEDEYFILYYQFLKHAFGLKHSNPTKENVNIRFYLDRLPDHGAKVEKFRKYIVGLNKISDFADNNLRILKDQIAEIDSHKHVVLQCLDIVLGAMYFRLNDLHLAIPEGKKRRGRRTVAKEELYKYICFHIKKYHTQFNAGISTGDGGDSVSRWLHPYRHWLFVPKNNVVDDSKTKRGIKR